MEAQKWRRKSGDTKVEAQKWRRKSGDTKVEAQKWRRKSGDTKVEAQKWRRKSGDTKVEAQKWRRKSGDTKVEAQKWRRKSGDTKVEAQKWGRKSGGAKVEAQKWRHKSGSAKVGAQKWRRKSGGAKVATQKWKRKSGGAKVATQKWRRKSGGAKVATQKWGRKSGGAKVEAQMFQAQLLEEKMWQFLSGHSFFNSIGEMHLVFLLILPILWPSVECNEQKVPKHSNKKPNHVDKITKDLGKMPTKIAGEKNYSRLEKYEQKINGKNSKNKEQLTKVIEGLNKKQCLLEAVFAKNSKKNIYSDEKEFKFFKKRLEEIDLNDPALSQLLEGLFAVGLSTNDAIKIDDANDLSAHVEKLKQTLAYTVFFMAKRGKILLEKPRGEKEKEPKAILIELIDIYNELQMDDEKMIKRNEENEQKGKEEKGKKERRFLQFVARSLEIEWDANAFSAGGQNDEDDDDTNRRRRRGKRRNAPPPGYYEWDQEANNPRTLAKILLIIAVLTVFTLVVNHFCTNRSLNNQSQRGTETSNFEENWSTNETTIESSKLLVTAYKAIPLEKFVKNGDEQNDECSICLGEIKPGTMVRPLPCKHIFDDACIEKWFMGGNITCPLCREKLQILPTAQTMTMANHLGVMAPPGGIVAPRVQVSGGTNEGQVRHGTVTGDQHEVVIDIGTNANQNGGNIGGTENHGPATPQHQATENTGGTENHGPATPRHEATETRLSNGSENETK
ncbi:hypothetical protein niasHT_018265 [Heterodera trifolii]|uniref:RING-type domain-containing protein n=1 Tax=Heterodera trifolii TaxID=157864 RepID=A0ABD2L9T2_9BILA